MKLFATKAEAQKLYFLIAEMPAVKMYTEFTRGTTCYAEGSLTGREFLVTGISVPVEESAIVRKVKPHIGVDNWGNWCVWVTSLIPKRSEADLEYRSCPVSTAQERCEAVLLANKQIILDLPYMESLSETIGFLISPPDPEYKEILI